jgi:hypothetical protein
MNTLQKVIKELIKKESLECNFSNVEDIMYGFQWAITELPDWPKVMSWDNSEYDSEEEAIENGEEAESLDTENFEIVSINEEEFEVCAGGDWQDPKTIVIGLKFNEGKAPTLQVTSIQDGFEEGMDEDSITDWFKGMM